MGMFTYEKPDNGINYAQSYQEIAKENNNGFFWYGSPAKDVGSTKAFDVKNDDQVSDNVVCLTRGSHSGDLGQTYCHKDSFIHFQTQAVSPAGIIHTGFYQMPLIGMMVALVFVGAMKWFKLKSKVKLEPLN